MSSRRTFPTSRKFLHLAPLLACSLAVTLRATAADAPAAAPTATSAEAQEIAALHRELSAVQGQLLELAKQNRDLMQRQQALEQRLMQQLANTSAPPAGAPSSAPAAPAAAPGLVSALPDTSVAASAAAAAAVSAAAPSAQSPGAALPATPGVASAAPATPGGGSAWDNLHLWGYGEVYFTDPQRVPSFAQADLARAVFGIGYTFDANTEFNSEYEVEHAVASASDVGEFEVEQFYVDHRLADWITARMGLFLMPFGLLNEHHEPTNFYGVQRNFVETLIIPSTWREGGLSFQGSTAVGIDWAAGVTTGFDLSKWNFTPEFPPYVTALNLEDSDIAPLQATHQELALANAREPSEFLSLNYFGVPGLTVGGAIFTGKAVQVPAPPNAPPPGVPRVTLWEGHVRWTPGRFDLSALYARGTISNTAAANAANPGSPNPLPSSFYGYFVQGAYQLWQHGIYRLDPFIRWELYDMGASYQGTTGPVIPAGLVPLSATPGVYGYWPINHDRVWTGGANFYITPHVVLKADYQRFEVNRDFSRLDLGLGLAF